GRKGSSRYFVEVKGKKAHSGNNHEDGINAITEAARQIVYLESLTDYKIGTTINVGSIKGGGKLNVVPDFAKFGVNVRVSTKKEQKRIDQLIKNLSPYENGIKLKVSGGINRPPMNKSEATEELFEIAQDVAADLDLGELEQAYVGGGSDGNFTASDAQHLKNKVYYVKREATYQFENYYLLSTQPSGEDGVIGWIRGIETSSHVHTLVDNDKKIFYLTGRGFASSEPWGGKRQYVHESLEHHGGLIFDVNETILIGNNVWYQGVIEGESESVWIHSNNVVSDMEELNDDDDSNN